MFVLVNSKINKKSFAFVKQEATRKIILESLPGARQGYARLTGRAGLVSRMGGLPLNDH